MIAYKFLDPGATSPFTGFRWSPPDGGPGAWVEAPVEPCRSGIHACRRDDLPLWLGRVLYEIELDGEIVEERNKVIASRGRLLRRIDAWDEIRVKFTRMCADRAHELARAEPALSALDDDIEPSIPDGAAMLGFMAAAIAEERGGMDAYRAERERQAAWLAERLRS